MVAINADVITSPAPRVGLGHRHPLALYVTRRVLAGAVAVFIASILIFIAVLILPGDVASIVLGRSATPDRVAAIEAQLSGGKPAWERYFSFLGHLLSGDLGYSTSGLVSGQKVPVSDVLSSAFGHSSVLAVIALVLFIPIMVGLGLVSGLRAGTAQDTVVSVASLAVSALPEFLVGTVLIEVLFDRLGWLPPISTLQPGESAWSNPKGLVMPVLTLLLVGLAFGSRQLRASVAEIVSQDYVAIARINGYSESRIVLRYVLPNALPPTVQIVAQQIQYLVAGIIVVESVFNFPGVGRALVQAISLHDTQEVLVIATLLAALYVAINIVADVICVLLDPRVRTTL